MHSITLHIANITIKISSEIKGLIERFAEFYKDYRVTENRTQPCYEIVIELKDLEVSINDNDTPLSKDQVKFQGYAIYNKAEENKSILYLSGIRNAYRYAEEHLLNVFSKLCIDNNKLLFHSATLYDNKFNTYIFFGPSGIGKSTLSRKLTTLNVLSDDIVVIEREGELFKLYKTPFERDKSSEQPLKVNIKGMYRLVQSSLLKKQKLSPGESATALLSNFWLEDYSTDTYETYFNTLNKVLNNIPVFELHLSKDTMENDIMTNITTYE